MTFVEGLLIGIKDIGNAGIKLQTGIGENLELVGKLKAEVKERGGSLGYIDRSA